MSTAPNEITLNADEIVVLKQMILQAWNTRGCMSWQEQLGMEDRTEEWLEDVVTDITQKLKITAEETW